MQIRSVSLVRSNGTIDYTVHSKFREPLLPHYEGVASLIQAATRFFERSAHNNKFGNVEFTLTVHEKIARVSIPFLNQVILLSLDKNEDHLGVINKNIFPIIKKSIKDLSN